MNNESNISTKNSVLLPASLGNPSKHPLAKRRKLLNEDKEAKATLSPGMILQDQIFEQSSEGRFLVYDGMKGEVFDSTFLIHDGIEIRPIKKLPWPSACMPTMPESDDPLTKEQLIAKLAARRFHGEFGDSERLFNEIKEFLMRHLDVSSELYYDVYATFIMMTWRVEDFKVVPYLFFLGPMASGKTRALECLNALCFRSIMASSVSAAVIFRVLECWHPTLLLDESELYNREGMIEALALLNAGYRRGQVALRMEKVEDGNPTIGFFDTFGPKALAGTEELASTLQSRSILTHMTKNTRHVELFIDEVVAQELRNKLLMYRFRNVGLLSEFNIYSLNGMFTNSRVVELFVSLLQVAPTEEIRERLIQCMKSITQTRFDEEQASIEAQVFEAILNSEDQIDKGKLSVRTVTERFNQGLPEKEQVTLGFMGRRVASLGFEKCRLSGGPRGFYWNLDLVERLRTRYYPSKTTSLPSQTSLPSLIMEPERKNDTPDSDVSDGNPTQNFEEGTQNNVNSDVSDRSDVSDVSLGVPPSTVSPDETVKVCGHCASWHKTSCSYPDADPSCVSITNKYAANCRNYVLSDTGVTSRE